RLLAQAGADLNVQDEKGDSPLHTVSRRWPSDDNLNVLHALIENGADLNARNQEGDTPLMTASSAEMAQVLVDAGADISVRNRDGRYLRAAQGSHQFRHSHRGNGNRGREAGGHVGACGVRRIESTGL